MLNVNVVTMFLYIPSVYLDLIIIMKFNDCRNGRIKYKTPMYLTGSNWQVILFYLYLDFCSLAIKTTQARSTKVCLQDTSLYHCVSRSVCTLGFLVGDDKYSGHARLIECIRLVSQGFEIDEYAYPIMPTTTIWCCVLTQHRRIFGWWRVWSALTTFIKRLCLWVVG